MTALNRAAEAAGLRPGMTLADARAVLPDVKAVEAEPAADAEALAQLADWCGRYTPWSSVDPHGSVGRDDEGDGNGEGGIWLDITGCAHLFGDGSGDDETALMDDLVTRLASLGFAAAAAVADTPGAAWAMARFGHKGRRIATIAPGNARAALASLPVAGLRLAASDAEALARLGLRAIGDLYGLPRAPLAKRFGEGITRRLDQALGTLAEPISPRRRPSRHWMRRVFAEPIGRADDIVATTHHLLEQLCRGLECTHAGARRLDLALYHLDGMITRATIGTSHPTRDPSHLANLFAPRLEGLDAGFGIEAMVLSAPVAEALAPAQLVAARMAPSGGGEALGPLVDRLANRLGPANVVRFLPRESHVPERALKTVSALGPGLGQGKGAALQAAAHAESWPDIRPRPLRLLARPEPVEVVAPVPDDPPILFRWHRVAHRVVHAEGPERIAPEWWRKADARPATKTDPQDPLAARTRDYYRVEDENGRRFWLYREGLYGDDADPAWYLHGMFG